MPTNTKTLRVSAQLQTQISMIVAVTGETEKSLVERLLQEEFNRKQPVLKKLIAGIGGETLQQETKP